MCLALSATRSAGQGQDPAVPQKVEIPPTATVLEGIPTVRIDSTEADTTRRVLSVADAAKDRLTVTVVDGRFYWRSRGDRPLRLSSTGAFTYLSSEPGTYIKITRVNNRISYVEHVDLGFESVTWWGEMRIVVGR
ncbi:MAG: hypothetical protein A3I61_17875 [Acidobacteria bacterium RIFCSPLOWO2_02_FULL_68_18]|nr:MAG: hypothetical protein A3I61_17875 [Acidobacteria bacterium RIFCSPLOWO2_02_FULL_68_18]OFW51485.1 MAG: hypothetical protein A3G77_18320 [Acidobacteria bacterium RIFCSPLOWO2_12_FULL_68_19]